MFATVKYPKVYLIGGSFQPRGEPRLELGVHVFGIMRNYFGIHQIMPLYVFYLEMKVEMEVGVHDIRSRFTSRFQQTKISPVLYFLRNFEYTSIGLG